MACSSVCLGIWPKCMRSRCYRCSCLWWKASPICCRCLTTTSSSPSRYHLFLPTFNLPLPHVACPTRPSIPSPSPSRFALHNPPGLPQHPFSPHDLSELSAFLNELAFSLTWEAPPSPSLPPASADAAKQLRESVLRLLSLLTERDARRAFCPPGAWLVRRLSLPQLRREMGEKKPRARSLLSTMPWAVPFEERVNVFRDLVSAEKASLPGEQMPEHLKGKHIKVRRASVLEDGYVQLSAGDAQQLKGTIRVEFVSELGLPEVRTLGCE